MPKYLADTTVIIEHSRGDTKAKEFLFKAFPYISTVTIAELIQGVRNTEELRRVQKIGKALVQIHIHTSISQKAIQLLAQFHLSHGLLYLDALIAATAIEKNLTLVTDNIKDFHFIKSLKLLPQREALNS